MRNLTRLWIALVAVAVALTVTAVCLDDADAKCLLCDQTDDGSAIITIKDVRAEVEAYGRDVQPWTIPCPDQDGDGMVRVNDVLIVLGEYGEPGGLDKCGEAGGE